MPTPDPYEVCRLSPADRTRFREMVENTRASLIEAVLSIPAALRQTAPEPDAWSPSEIVQHILLAEASLRRRVHSTLTLAPDPHWAALTDGIEQRLLTVLPAQGKAKAPEALTHFEVLAQASAPAAIEQSSLETLALLDQCGDLPIKALIFPSAFFGDLSAWHWLLYIPLHTQRHIAQLRRCLQ